MPVTSRRVVATIEARMSSRRLPGKHLLESGAGIPFIQLMTERVRASKTLDALVVATTSSSADDILADFLRSLKIDVFRGSELDVMDRVLSAGLEADADLIVELTGDCPLIDPRIIDCVVDHHTGADGLYVTNVLDPSFPVGMDVQVFTPRTLSKSLEATTHPLDREHVTRHIRSNPEMFSHVSIQAPMDLQWPQLWLTLDTPEDERFLRGIVRALSLENDHLFDCRSIISYLHAHPDLLALIEDVPRRGLDD